MTDTPQPQLEAMLDALARLPSVTPAALPPSTTPPLTVAQPDGVEMTVEAMFDTFRRDMRAAGLGVYDVVHDVLGVGHDGPAVNVRDPSQAMAATQLTLASLGLAPGLWRMYPVLAPITL